MFRMPYPNSEEQRNRPTHASLVAAVAGATRTWKLVGWRQREAPPVRVDRLVRRQVPLDAPLSSVVFKKPFQHVEPQGLFSVVTALRIS